MTTRLSAPERSTDNLSARKPATNLANSPTEHTDTEISREPALLYPVSEAAQLLGIGRTNVYYLMNDGKLASVRIGSRRLIPRAALESFVAELPAA